MVLLLFMGFDRVSLCICDWLTFSDNDFRKPGSEETYQAVATEVDLVVRMGKEYTDKGGGDGFTEESDMAHRRSSWDRVLEYRRTGVLVWKKKAPKGVALLGVVALLE